MLWKRTTVMLIAFAGLAVLAALVVAVPRGGHGPALELTPIATDDIQKIEVTRPDGGYSLARADGKWLVEPGDHPADENGIKRALDELTKLRIGAMVSDSAANFGKYEVEDGGLSVSVSGPKGALWSLLLGKETADKSGIYVRLAGEDRVFIALGRLRASFDRAADTWRDRAIFAFKPEDVRSVTFNGAAGEFSVVRKDEEPWRLEPQPADLPDGYRLDGEKVTRVVRQMANLRAVGFEDEAAESIDRGLSPAAARVSVTTQDGTAYTLNIGAEQNKQYYAAREGDAQVYLIPAYAADSLRVGIGELRDMHVAAFDAAKVTTMTIRQEKRQLELAVTDNKWRVEKSSEPVPDGFVFDDAKAAMILRRLASLQGKSLVGRQAPTAAKMYKPYGTIEITLDDGTRKTIAFGAEAADKQRYVVGDEFTFLVDARTADELLPGLDQLKVSQQRPQQQPVLSPEMLDKLPPQIRDQFLQEQRKKIMQQQIMQQMMKQAPPGSGGTN